MGSTKVKHKEFSPKLDQITRQHLPKWALPLVVVASISIIGTGLILTSKADSTYQPVPAQSNIFSPTSFASQPVDSVTQLNADSAGMVANFINQYKTNYGAVGVNTREYSMPFYTAKTSDPRYDVRFYDCQKKGYLPSTFVAAVKQVPIPDGAVGAPGTDSAMSIYSPAEDTLWELWKAHKADDGSWSACWAGKITPVSKSQGVFTWPSGLSASGLSYWALTPKISELSAGHIDHAIGIAMVHNGNSKHYSYPANRSDGLSPLSAQHQIYEGQRFRLDPSVNVDALNMTPFGKMVAKAIQKYGLISIDGAGAVSMSTESAVPYTNAGLPNPYTQLFAGRPSYEQFKGMPWDKLQALPFDYGKPAAVASHAPPGTVTVDIGSVASPDTTAPSVSISAPTTNSTLNGTKTITATVSDNKAVTGVQFKLDGTNLGNEITTATNSSYSFAWDSTKISDGTHAITAVARDAVGNSATSTVVTVTVRNDQSEGLLWTSNYDAVMDLLSVKPAWAHEQEPHSPGINGPTATDRIRVVGANDVPAGTNKPSGKALRVELRPYNATPDGHDGDVNPSANTNRAEVYDRYPLTPATSTSADKWPDPVGSTRWYSFSVYVPANFSVDDSKWLDITQWKGMYGGSPPEAIEIDGGNFRLGGTHGLKNLGSINRGQWTKFTVGFSWSTDAKDGWVQIFRDGKEVVPKTARATMDKRGTGADPIYFKQGIYRTKSWAVTHVLYFGPTKVGLTKQAVESATALPAPVVDTQAPTVSLLEPKNSSTVSGIKTLSATANDNIANSSVQFKLDGVNLGNAVTTSKQGVYSYDWNTKLVPNGTHSLVAIARDAAGNMTTSTPITFAANNVVAPPPDTSVPEVSLTSPAANSSLKGSTVITANASDNKAVTKVVLYIDGILVATDVAAPYSFSWDTTKFSDGNHSVSLAAYDAANNRTTTPAITVTLANIVPVTEIPGDIDGNGVVNILDLRQLGKNWGQKNRVRNQGDSDGNGIINIYDLLIIGKHWGNHR